MGEPCLCGDPTCRWWFPGSWRHAKAEEEHDMFHEVRVPDCPFCVQERVTRILLRYDRMRKRAGKDPLPEDMLKKATLRLRAREA